MPGQMTIKKRWIILPVLLAAPFIAWKATFPTYTHRYRLTVNIEADGKLYSGSSVIEVRRHFQPPIAVQSRHYTRIVGVSPVVKLGSRGVVVAALKPHLFLEAHFDPHPRYAQKLAYCAIYGPECEGPKSFKEFPGDDRNEKLQSKAGLWTLGQSTYPGFVWFSNFQDGLTALPMLAKDMPNKIGATLRSVTVEMVEDPVSGSDFFTPLPWIRESTLGERSYNATERGDRYEPTAQQFVSGIDVLGTE